MRGKWPYQMWIVEKDLDVFLTLMKANGVSFSRWTETKNGDKVFQPVEVTEDLALMITLSVSTKSKLTRYAP